MKQQTRVFLACAALLPASFAQSSSVISAQFLPTTSTSINSVCTDAALHTTVMVYPAYFSTYFESASAIYNLFGDNNTLFVSDAPTTVILSTTLTTTIINTLTAVPTNSATFGSGLPTGTVNNADVPFILGYVRDATAIVPEGYESSSGITTDPKQATVYTLRDALLAGVKGGAFARNATDAFNALTPVMLTGDGDATFYLKDGILHVNTTESGEGAFFVCPDGLFVGYPQSPGPDCAAVTIGVIAVGAPGIQPTPSGTIPGTMTTPTTTTAVAIVLVTTTSNLSPLLTSLSSTLTSTTDLASTTTTTADTTTTLGPVQSSSVAACPRDDGAIIGNYTVYCNVGLDGLNIDSATAPFDTFQGCIDACSATVGCVSVSYDRVSTFCYQHSTLHTLETNVGGDFDSAELVDAIAILTTTSDASTSSATSTLSTTDIVSTSGIETTTTTETTSTSSVITSSSIMTTSIVAPTGTALCPSAAQGAVYDGYAVFCNHAVNGGANIANAVTDNVASLEVCISICSNTPNCVGVSYMRTGSQTCYPHAEYNSLVDPSEGAFDGAYLLSFAPGGNPTATSSLLITTTLTTTSIAVTTTALSIPLTITTSNTAIASTSSSVPSSGAGSLCPNAAQGTTYNGFAVFCGHAVNGGANIDSAITNNVPSIEACIQICQSTTGCVGLSYQSSGSQTCYPHSQYNDAPNPAAGAFDGAYLISAAPGAAVPVLTSLANNPTSAASSIVASVTNVLQNPTSAVSSAVSGLSEIASNPTSALSSVLSTVVPTSAVSSVLSSLTSGIAPVNSIVTSAVPTTVVSSALSTLTSALSPLMSVVPTSTLSSVLVVTSAVPTTAINSLTSALDIPPVLGSSSASSTAAAAIPVSASSLPVTLPVATPSVLPPVLGGGGATTTTTTTTTISGAAIAANTPTAAAQEYVLAAPYCNPTNATYYGYEIHCGTAISADPAGDFGGNIPPVGTPQNAAGQNQPYTTATLGDCIEICNEVPTCISVSWHYQGTETVHECYLHNGDLAFNGDIGYHSAIRLGSGSPLLTPANSGKTYEQGGGQNPVAPASLKPTAPGVAPSILTQYAPPTSTTTTAASSSSVLAAAPIVGSAAPAAGVPAVNLKKRMGYNFVEEMY